MEAGDVVLRWMTEDETSFVGFRVLRKEPDSHEFVPVTTDSAMVIATQADTPNGAMYEFVDTTAQSDVAIPLHP